MKIIIKNFVIIFLLLILFTNLSFAKVFLVPFELQSNMIIVHATINGNVENFIFDTGARGLVINKKFLQTETPGSDNEYSVKGVGNKLEKVRDIAIEDFKFGAISKQNINALSLDISLIDELTDKNIFGLIGYDIFAPYDIVIDYNELFLTFISEDEFMNYWNSYVINQEFYIVEFSMFEHLPVVQAKAGEKRIKLGIDTGAARTIIDKNALELIQHELTDISDQNIVGIENENIPISGAKIREISIDPIHYNNINILIKDLSHLNTLQNGRINGLMGYDLLKNYKTLISFSNKKIVFIK